MKKVLSLILVLMLLLTACGGKPTAEAPLSTTATTTAPEETAALLVGFSKVCITPATSEPLAGYSDNDTRLSENVAEDIYATCIAVTSGEETILLYTIDTLNADHWDAQEYRHAIEDETGIALDKIFIGATHAHNCPADDGTYKVLLKGWLKEAAQEALADRSPATVEAATPTIEGMNFVRHYKMSDGTYAGSNFGSFADAEIEDYAAQADNQAVLIKFLRGEDKQDVLMINWQAHPDKAKEIGYNSIAPSWIGSLRDTVEAETGMLVAYFTGASGNLVPDSRIKEDKHGLSWQDYGKEAGLLLAAAASTTQPISGEGIQTRQVMQTVQIDHSWDAMYTEADEVFKLWKSNGLEAGTEKAKEYGFSSVYQARAIRTRSQKPKTDSMELNVFSIGDIGFTAGTYEMFSESGAYVKENSPFAVTFLITGNSGYIRKDFLTVPPAPSKALRKSWPKNMWKC